MEISNLTKKSIEKYLAEGKRFDGRKPLEHRELLIETGVSEHAEGSARVKLGDTEVLVGVKLGVGEPYPDGEDEGTLITTAELTPSSSPKFESGPPRIEAIELARVVDRGVRESGFIDFKKLCIKKGEKVWTIFLDIYSINADGNLLDAAAFGAIAALKTAKMPKYDAKTEKIKYGELTKDPVPVSDKLPITITFHKIGKEFLVDPVEGEEDSSEGRLSLALTKKGNSVLINASQKGKEEIFDKSEILKVIDASVDKFNEIHPKVKKMIEGK